MKKPKQRGGEELARIMPQAHQGAWMHAWSGATDHAVTQHTMQQGREQVRDAGMGYFSASLFSIP